MEHSVANLMKFQALEFWGKLGLTNVLVQKEGKNSLFRTKFAGACDRKRIKKKFGWPLPLKFRRKANFSFKNEFKRV